MEGSQKTASCRFATRHAFVLHVYPIDGRLVSFAQLHEFTPSPKSLRPTFNPVLFFGGILGLVYPLPLLDDLLLTGVPVASDARIRY